METRQIQRTTGRSVVCPDMTGFRRSPDDGSSYAVQTHLPEKQRVENRHVGGGDRLQEGIRFITTCSSLEISLRNRSITIRLPSDKLCADQHATVLTDVESD